MRVRAMLPALSVIIVTGLGLGAAAPAVAAASVTSSQVAVVADDGLNVHRGKYFSLGACQAAGQQGIERGHWDRYQCAKNWLWNLWTNR